MRLRILGLAAAVTLSIGALAGCTSSSSTAPSGNTGGTPMAATGVDDGTKLTMWSRAPLEKQAKNAVAAYNASHKNQVQLELLPNDDVEGKVGSAAQTNSLPDILAGDVVRIPYWVQQGIFMDLTTQIDGLPNKAQLQSGHIEAGTADGKEHTLPFVTDISVMVWNKDLYKQAGLDPDKGPANLSDFVTQAKAVAGLNQAGVAGTYVAGQSGGALMFTLFPMMWASGADVIRGNSANLDSQAAHSVYDAYRELAQTPNGIGAGSKEETGATWTAPFSQGKIGVMQYPYTSVSSLFTTAGFDIGVTGIPGITGGQSTFLGGDAIGVSRDSKNVAQAWNFMSWLMSDAAQQQVFADNNDTASSLTVLANGYSSADPRTRIANDTIKNGQTPIAVNCNEAFNAAGSPWQLLIQDAIWGDGTKVAADNNAISAVLANT
ncbi:MAG: extracellular solute-binding protein [Propionibacteriaceae bacterium]|nr:extracellular solute-binding protein [Propionibacteriaceae bacterium]